MRHKYETRGIVLARTPYGEAHAGLAILTADLGLVRARAAGVRRSESKLAHALVTFAESDLVLVAGREGWRVAGAVLRENWFARLGSADTRERAGRITGLMLRIAPGEAPESALLPIISECFWALASEPALVEGAELLAAASLLAALGFHEAEQTPASFAKERLVGALAERERYIALINRGIAASGL